MNLNINTSREPKYLWKYVHERWGYANNRNSLWHNLHLQEDDAPDETMYVVAELLKRKLRRNVSIYQHFYPGRSGWKDRMYWANFIHVEMNKRYHLFVKVEDQTFTVGGATYGGRHKFIVGVFNFGDKDCVEKLKEEVEVAPTKHKQWLKENRKRRKKRRRYGGKKR